MCTNERNGPRCGNESLFTGKSMNEVMKLFVHLGNWKFA